MSGTNTKVQGDIFEGNLRDILHVHYASKGIATMWQAGTVAKMINKQWRPMKSLPDFQGVLAWPSRGHFVAFDAKTSAGGVYSHAKKSMHQCQHLLKVREAGGLAFILVHRLDDDSGWMLFPQEWWADDKGWSIHLTDERLGMSPELGKRCFKFEGAWQFIPDWHATYHLGTVARW
jgi:hypothetical protein